MSFWFAVFVIIIVSISLCVDRQQCVARIHNRFNTAVSGVTTSVSQGEEETLVEWNTSHTSLFMYSITEIESHWVHFCKNREIHVVDFI